LEELSPSTREMKKLLPFLQKDGFANAVGDGIRDIDGHTVSAILEADVGKYHRMRKEGRPTDGLIIPAPVKGSEKAGGLPPHLHVTKNEYSGRLGLIC
jgi:hypothetical protein